jgi:hypothetical protein
VLIDSAFVIIIFGGMITIMLLGFALHQIPDANFAGIIDEELEKTEKGEGSTTGSKSGTSAEGGRKVPRKPSV